MQRSEKELERSEGKNSQLALRALSTLGYLYSMTGGDARSLLIQREVYRRTMHRWGANSQAALVELLNLGSDEHEVGDLKQALEDLHQAETGLRVSSGANSAVVQAARVEQASVLSGMGRNAEALHLLDSINPKAYQATTSDPGRAQVLEALKAQVGLRAGIRGARERLRKAIAAMQAAGVSEEDIKPFRETLASSSAPSMAARSR